MTIPADLTSAQAAALSGLQAGDVIRHVGSGLYADADNFAARRFALSTLNVLADRKLATWDVEVATGERVLMLAVPAPTAAPVEPDPRDELTRVQRECLAALEDAGPGAVLVRLDSGSHVVTAAHGSWLSRPFGGATVNALLWHKLVRPSLLGLAAVAHDPKPTPPADDFTAAAFPELQAVTPAFAAAYAHLYSTVDATDALDLLDDTRPLPFVDPLERTRAALANWNAADPDGDAEDMWQDAQRLASAVGELVDMLAAQL